VAPQGRVISFRNVDGSGGINLLPYNPKLKERAKSMRTKATPQEDKLWYQFLRTHPCPFLRQRPINNYIVDFLAYSKKLVIEIDGAQHYTEDGKEYDNIRTSVLEGMGLHIMRFTNAEVDSSFQEVCDAIQGYLDGR